MPKAAFPRSSPSPRRMTLGRFRKAILLAGGSAAVLVAGLVGATNLVLRSDWLSRQINSDPDSLFVAYTGARSFSPGQLRFDTLVLRSRDSNVEWEARLEGVTLRVRLFDLPRRRLRAESVRADALSFRLRERLERRDATPARLARYPPITGFAGPPILGPPAPAAPPGDPWTVVVHDLSVKLLREVWIDSWRWTGEAGLTGGFSLHPGVAAEVFPAEIAVLEGTLHWGKEAVSSGMTGSVRASIQRFVTHSYPGNDVWKIVSGTASLRGSLDTLAFLSPAGGGPHLAPGGAGTVRVRVALREGRGSARLDAETPAVIVRLGGRTVRGEVHADLVARPIDFPGGRIDLDGSRVGLHGWSVEGSSGKAWGGALELPKARLGLAAGSCDASLSVRLGDGRPLVALLSGPPRWAAGLLDLRDLEASGHLHASRRLLALSAARVEAGTFSIDGDWRAAEGRYWGALLVRRGALSLGVGLGGSGTSLHLARAQDWFAGEGRPGGLRTDRAGLRGGQ